MAWYRVYFLSNGGRIADRTDIEGDSDIDAVTVAHVMLGGNDDCTAVEVWQNARPVFLHPMKGSGEFLPAAAMVAAAA
jgi:hypothetical protein